MIKTEKQTLPAPKFHIPTRILILSSVYHRDIAENLVREAAASISRASASYDIVEIPSVLEIPTAIRLASAARYFDGYIALGCVVRGNGTDRDTPYSEISHGLMLLGLEGLCVTNGILAAENHEQAALQAERSGRSAAEATMHLISLKRRFTKTGAGRISPPSEHILMAGEARGNQGTA